MAENDQPNKKPGLTTTEPAGSAVRMATYLPRTDMYETEEEVVVRYDLPGVKSEDVDLHFEGGMLTLHGKIGSRPRPAEYSLAEYGIGDFHRTQPIPTEVDATKLSAECKLGVLTVHLPKHERVKPHKITVKAG